MKRIRALPQFLRDKKVPKRKKALVIFGIIYLFLPVDLIPPILFPFGFIDDIIIWIFILWHLWDDLGEYCGCQKEKNISKKFRDKNIVEGVEFNVEDDENKDKE